MQLTTFLLAGAAAILNTVNAVPINGNTTIHNSFAASSNFTFVSKAKASSICEDCMSCTATQKSIVLEYSVHIGAPFANGIGCESVKNTLEEAARVPEISDYTCKDDGHGMTKLKFKAWDYNQGWEISQALNRAYPAVKRKMGYGFNCPNE